MESTRYIFLTDGVFLLCDHGLDFDISLCENSSNESINQSIKCNRMCPVVSWTKSGIEVLLLPHGLVII